MSTGLNLKDILSIVIPIVGVLGGQMLILYRATNKRIDDMNNKMDKRFDDLHKRIDDTHGMIKANSDRIDQVSERLDKLSARFDELQNTLLSIFKSN